MARTDQRGVHQFEHRTLAEGMRNDFGTPALLTEQPLERNRRANGFAMRNRQAQTRDARFEGIQERPGRAGQLALEALDELVPGQAF